MAQSVFTFVEGSTGYDAGISFFETSDKGFYLFGNWDTETGTYYTNNWITKLDSAGNYEWGWNYPYIGNEYSRDGVTDSDGNFLIYGNTGHGTFLSKISPLGTLLKRTTWITELRDLGIAILPINDTCFITADNVYFNSSPSTVDSITMCLTLRDSSANVIWRRIHNTNWSNEDNADVTLLSDYNVLWTYPVKDSTILEKVGLDGSLIWRKSLPIGSCAKEYTVIQLPNENILLNSCTSLICMDINGNDVWTISNYYVTGLSIIDSSRLYAIGTKSSWVHYGCSYPTYVTEHDYNGNFLRTKLYLYGYKCISVEDFKTTSDGGWAFTGSFAPVSPYDSQLIFHKDDTLAPFIGIQEYVFEDNLTKYTMFPNPANTELYLHLDNDVVGGEILTQDLTGKVLNTQVVNVTDKTMDVSTLPNGVYLVSLKHKEYTETKKLVIQHN